MSASIQFDPTTHPHRRYNPLTGEHILVSPHRTKRPWRGQVEPPQPASLAKYQDDCYLCPGNTRMGGGVNPQYEGTYTFTNDFSAVLPPPGPDAPPSPHPLLTTEPTQGNCDVICFHPRHDLTLPLLKIKDVEAVIDGWRRIYEERGNENEIEYVQIFENKGAMMGCSNPHPHGQVWSLSSVPTIPETEYRHLKRYAASTPLSEAPKGHAGKACLLCDYAHFEVNASEEDGRVVVKNEHWVAVVPWWATWPFEVLLLPYHRHIACLSDLTAEEKTSFAKILSEVTIRYDNLFQCSFAYSMGIHQLPTPPSAGKKPKLSSKSNIAAPISLLQPPAEDAASGDDYEYAHLHLHFAPPLLRSATVRKFLVGFELMAEAQRDLTAEQAAAKLRAVSTVHYLTTMQSQETGEVKA